MRPRGAIAWRRPLILVAAMSAALASAACMRPPDHVPGPSSEAQVGPEVPLLQPPSGDAASAALFLGLEGLYRDLLTVRAWPTARGREPTLRRLDRLEDAVERRFARGTQAGAVRHVAAWAAAGWLPLAPAHAAAYIVDPQIEQEAFGMTRLYRTRRVFALPGVQRDEMQALWLDVGTGPFRFDLSFAMAIETWVLPDGRVLIRADILPEPRPQHVTLFRAAILLEPEDGGTRLSEILLFGTDVSVPGFIWDTLRGLADDALTGRSRRLFARMWAAAGR